MTNDDFIPYGKHNISEEDIQSVLKVLESNFITQGPKIKEFEDKVASDVGSKYCVATNSATSSLHVACLALGLAKDDILWTSSITFVASANVGRYCGAKIDFVEIDPETGLMCIDSLRNKLEIATKTNNLPKVVIPVHLAGSSCDMEEIFKLSLKYGFHIIEDASHAIGGTYKNLKVGCCKYSSITVFSFHPVKIITTGEGGAATTNNENLARKMRMFSSHGITKDSNYFIGVNKNLWNYEQQYLGYNYRITDIQCALGLSQLRRLDIIVKKRNALLKEYKHLLSGLPIKVLKVPENVKSAVHLAVILITNCSELQYKNIFNYLISNKIGVQLHYYPVHLQPYYRSLGFQEGYLPISEEYAKTALSIPLFPELNVSQQHRVVRLIKESLIRYL